MLTINISESLLQFNEYLKTCRNNHHLTQEELVQELYNFDNAFIGLDTVTLSRWERGTTKPSAAKQVMIVQLFQKYSSHLFPCFYDQENVEEELCIMGIKNLIANSKEHIINFPSNIFSVDNISISHIRSHDNLELILNMPQSIIEGLTSNYFQITTEHLKEWSLHPSNLFLLAQSNSSFFGMLFSIKLKTQVFKEIITFSKKLNEIKSDDFAAPNEQGSIFPISFFAYNDRVASMLYIRLFAHFIANQDLIIEVGTIPLLEGGKKLSQKIHLLHNKDEKLIDKIISSYSAPLEEVIINEDVLKMIFLKQECPEDSF